MNDVIEERRQCHPSFSDVSWLKAYTQALLLFDSKKIF